MQTEMTAPGRDLRELTSGDSIAKYQQFVDFFGTMLSKSILRKLAEADLPFIAARPGAPADEVRTVRLWQILRTAMAYEALDYWQKASEIAAAADELADPNLTALADIEWMALHARLDHVQRDPIAGAQKASSVLTGLEQLASRVRGGAQLSDEMQLICLLFTGAPFPFTEPWSASAWLAGRGTVLYLEMLNLAVWSHEGSSLAESARTGIDRFFAFMDEARQGKCALPSGHVAYLSLRLARLAAVALNDDAVRYANFVIASTQESLSTHFDAVELLAECHLSQGDSKRAADYFRTLSTLGRLYADPISVALGTSGAAVALGSAPEVARTLTPNTALRYLKTVFDETPAGDDPSTRYVLKRGADHIYQAAAAAGAGSLDRANSELVAAALWCITSSDFALRFMEPDKLLIAEVRQDQFANLGAIMSRTGDDAAMYASLRRELVPLAMVESMRDRLETNEAIVILSPAGSGYVWAAIAPAIGFRTGAFDATDEMNTIGDLLEQQFAADLLDDRVLAEDLEQDIRRESERLTACMQPDLLGVIGGAQTIYYVAGSSAIRGSFPLEMLSVGGRLLCEQAVVARAPSIDWLRGHFADMKPSSPRDVVHARFLVVAGAEQLEGVQLEAQDVAIRAAAQRLRGLGLEGSTVSIDSQLDSLDLPSISILHFVGHGFATDAYEGLPSRHGKILDAASFRRLPVRPDLALFEACSVGRMRYVQGGLHDGLPSALVSNGVGAIVAFCKTVPETRARIFIDRIYTGLSQTSAGEAVVQARSSGGESTPAYMQAALLYYGDTAALPGTRDRPIRSTRQGWRAQTIRHLILQRPDTIPSDQEPPPGFPDALWLVLRDCLQALVYPRKSEITVDRNSIQSLFSGSGFTSSLDRLALSATGYLTRIPLPDLSQRRPFAPKLFAPNGEVVAVLGDYTLGISARALEATGYALGEPVLQALGGLLADLWLLELALASDIFTPGDLSKQGSDMLTEADAITSRGLDDEMRILQPMVAESTFVRDLLAAAERTVSGKAKLATPLRLKKDIDWRDAARGVLDRFAEP